MITYTQSKARTPTAVFRSKLLYKRQILTYLTYCTPAISDTVWSLFGAFFMNRSMIAYTQSKACTPTAIFRSGLLYKRQILTYLTYCTPAISDAVCTPSAIFWCELLYKR